MGHIVFRLGSALQIDCIFLANFFGLRDGLVPPLLVGGTEHIRLADVMMTRRKLVPL